MLLFYFVGCCHIVVAMYLPRLTLWQSNTAMCHRSIAANRLLASNPMTHQKWPCQIRVKAILHDRILTKHISDQTRQGTLRLGASVALHPRMRVGHLAAPHHAAETASPWEGCEKPGGNTKGTNKTGESITSINHHVVGTLNFVAPNGSP